MKNRALIIGIFSMFLLSCKSVKVAKGGDKIIKLENDIIFLNIDQKKPDDAVFLRNVKLGYGILKSDCTYEDVILKVQDEAKKLRGNIIKIVEYKPTNIVGKNCYKLRAKIYKYNDLQNYLLSNNLGNDESKDFSKIHLYRYPSSLSGSLLEDDLFLGDSLIGRVKTNFKKSIPIYKEGKIYLKVGEKNRIDSISINIESGKNYYIHASLKARAVGRARLILNLKEEKQGKLEYELFIPKKRK